MLERNPPMRRLLSSVLLLLMALPVFAADPCPLLRTQTRSAVTAQRIAAVACEANQHWFRPFIDADGRTYGPQIYEAENSRLADGGEAWRHVAKYWNDSGLLGSAYGRAGASECGYAASASYPSPACRSFIIDTPWSAAFVSWVMREAQVPGFNGSASHVNYVRDAYRSSQPSPYTVHDPRSARPALGDLLCYVRVASRTFGFADLASLLSQSNNEGLGMHCDIVVGVNPGNSQLAYLVGGNVNQAVTLRKLRLAPNGYFADLPIRTPGGPECNPDQADACNANRQDWAVLLKLKSGSELAALPPPAPQIRSGGGMPAAPPCCTVCVVGSSVPRCPPPGTMSNPLPAVETDPSKRIPGR
ncbi:MAG: DUF2272 domain-containing protein [Pseudoxanthomonas suwonensis]|nr:MAG: DUF2272 domain-containing protein [Pseudoxanthomonas suwonensis]